MRQVAGEIAIPSDFPASDGAVVLIEVRDVARADALSAVVAQTRLTGVKVRPGDRIPFSLAVPEASGSQSLDIRVHISPAGGNVVKSGDLLTTSSHPVPSRGAANHLSVVVTRI